MIFDTAYFTNCLRPTDVIHCVITFANTSNYLVTHIYKH